MTVTLRDLPVQITIADSCNCFNWCCKAEKPVYLTHDWKAEPFDFKKSQDTEADKKKTLERIKNLFTELDESFYSVKTEINVPEDGWITFHHIYEINERLKMYDI